MTLEEKLVLPSLAIMGTGSIFHGIKFIDRDSFPIVTHHIGNFSLVAGFTIAAGLVQNKLNKDLDNMRGKVVPDIKMKNFFYLPEITSALLSTYLIGAELGILPLAYNTPDLLDIPAIVLGASSSYILQKYLVKLVNH